MLLGAGVDVTIEDKSGATAQMLAVASGQGAAAVAVRAAVELGSPTALGGTNQSTTPAPNTLDELASLTSSMLASSACDTSIPAADSVGS